MSSRVGFMPSRREASKYIFVFDGMVNQTNSIQRHTPIFLLLEITPPPSPPHPPPPQHTHTHTHTHPHTHTLFTSGALISQYFTHYTFACFYLIYYFMTFIPCFLIIIIIIILQSLIQKARKTKQKFCTATSYIFYVAENQLHNAILSSAGGNSDSKTCQQRLECV